MKTDLSFINYICFAFLTFVFLGCKNSSSDLAMKMGFGEFKKLESSNLSSSNVINRATNMYLFDSLLFVGDRDSEFHFKIIDIKQDKLISKFGKEGKGPCEVTFPVRLNWLDSDRQLISLYDRQRFKTHTYHLSNIFHGDNVECLSSSTTLNSNFQLVAQIDSFTVLGTGLFKGRYATQTIGENEVKESTIGFPQTADESQIDFQILAMAYQGKFLKHPIENKFVSTSLYSFSFDILEFNENKDINLINQIHHWSPEFIGTSGKTLSATMKEGNKFGCLDVAVSTNFIYILFSGKTNTLEDSRESETVLVYDWNGNPITFLTLDKKIKKIAVSQDDHVLAAFIDTSDPQLVLYNLN